MAESKPVIKISDFHIEAGSHIRYDLSYPPEIADYFRTNDLEVIYGVDISDVPPGILYIPAVSNVVQVAWATGVDVQVSTLDATFAAALTLIQEIIKSFVPAFPCSTSIHVDRLETNRFRGSKVALLFSGGLDSVTSLIKCRDKVSVLIFLRGADIPLRYKEFVEREFSRNARFAASQGLDFASPTIDIWSFLNHKLLTADFGRYLANGSWWGGLHHMVAMVGTCAPLSIVFDIGEILIGSSYTGDYREMQGAQSAITNSISYAGITATEVCSDSGRQVKIREILKPYIQTTGHCPELRVCCNQWEILNCCRCEKCCRTIVGLVLEGIDPKRVGFPVGGNILKYIKGKLLEGEFTQTLLEVYFWKEIQRQIPPTLSHDIYGGREFFAWLKKFDIKASAPKKSLRNRLLSKFPSGIQSFIVSLYNWVKRLR